ncbi:MAG: TraX family protein [Candidatus Moraniibacteriota bacterium]
MTTPTWRLQVSDGTLEGVKWLALFSMVYDHVMRLLFMGPVLGPVTTFGRLAFPLFAFILAYNLARPGVDDRVYRRMVLRLVGFGLLALPASIYLVGAHMLNILFTFAAAVTLLWMLHLRPLWFAVPVALLFFAAAGTQVEYGWQGLVLALSFCCFIQRGVTFDAVAVLAAGFMALAYSNGSHWGTLSLPIILGLSQVKLPFPRNKWFFYIFYPAHLTLIALLAWYFVRS